MPESPLLFSPVVPACGFCLQVQSKSRGVKESRSWEVKRRPYLSGGSLWRRWAIPGLPDSPISLPGNPATEPGGTTPKKHKNDTNEASMLLKTHGAFGKRTQNELKNEPNLGYLGRELMPNSELARLNGKKPLVRLATLATLPDFRWSDSNRTRNRTTRRRGPLSRFGREPEAMRENTKIGGTKRECL
jgi:hypothetical protein